MATRTPLCADRLLSHPIVSEVQLLLHDVVTLIASPIYFYRTVSTERSRFSPLRAGVLGIQISVIVGGLLMLAGVTGIQGLSYVVLYWTGIVTGQQMLGLEVTGAGLIIAIVLAPVFGVLLLLGSTRLLARWRSTTESSPVGVFANMQLDIGYFVMERKMLLGIKERAENVTLEQPARQS